MKKKPAKRTKKPDKKEVNIPMVISAGFLVSSILVLIGCMFARIWIETYESYCLLEKIALTAFLMMMLSLIGTAITTRE